MPMTEIWIAVALVLISGILVVKGYTNQVYLYILALIVVVVFIGGMVFIFVSFDPPSKKIKPKSAGVMRLK